MSQGPFPDHGDFSPLLKDACQVAKPKAVAADAGFDSEAAHELARDELGVQSLINPTHGRPSSKEPTGRYRRQMKRHLKSSRYGQRWQVETVFSMIKRCSGDVVDATTHHRRRRRRRRLIHLHVMRKADFRKGERLGKGDHLVRWPKPTVLRSVDWQTYKALPEFLTIRECRIPIEQPGFRTKSILVVTTLLDAERYPKEDLAELYRARWNAELDLRSLKETLQMDVLRCKTPSLACKEIWTHTLAYNLIRTVMAQAATEHQLQPRSISFKGALETLEAFGPVIGTQEQQPERRKQLYLTLLDAIAQHRVANRPDRFEPRVRKRRPKKYPRMKRPRHEIKELMAKGLVKI